MKRMSIPIPALATGLTPALVAAPVDNEIQHVKLTNVGSRVVDRICRDATLLSCSPRLGRWPWGERAMDRNRVVSRRAIVCVLLLGAILSTSVAQAVEGRSHKHKESATVCYVDKFHYSNNGAYTVGAVELHFVTGSSQMSIMSASDYSDELGSDIKSGGSATIDLNRLDGKHGDLLNSTLTDGEEVWIRVNITFGEKSSCHKDGHRLVYKKGIGRSIDLESAGTTTKGNRCEFSKNIAKQCDGSLPDGSN